jgi:hypothetical protein
MPKKEITMRQKTFVISKLQVELLRSLYRTYGRGKPSASLDKRTLNALFRKGLVKNRAFGKVACTQKGKLLSQALGRLS